ncbi:MAG TPA: CopG family ribbon-helix-helix protein [Caulobacteraceae bacterium]|jgi:CopG family nickel-responsive transcriptional regulator|nr:CopG family ribbon-helix-helix protein [Caulobacteraceae bacterium]
MDVDAPRQLARLSLSLPAELLSQLDAMIVARGLPNRSQTICEMIRHELADHNETQDGAVIAGTITLIYRAESGRVRHALAQTQSTYLKEVISSQHVFLEDDQSLEVLLVQGPTERLRGLCDALRKIRGVQQIKLVVTTALLPPLHAHGEAETSARSARAGAAS